MADVSVQNERINGWIPSSATNVILNWPERIKTQPHDNRDNCFLHFDSKGSCGMTVNNDIDDDSATKHGDSHNRRAIETLAENGGLLDLGCFHEVLWVLHLPPTQDFHERVEVLALATEAHVENVRELP